MGLAMGLAINWIKHMNEKLNKIYEPPMLYIRQHAVQEKGNKVNP